MSRILVIAHGHPDISPGGGEIAAAAEVAQLRALGHTVLFVARVKDIPGREGGVFAARGMDVLFRSPNYDHFLHSQRSKWALHKEFAELIRNFAPDAAHVHHYVHIGIEILRILRQYSEAMPIVLTLHEYLAICHNQGQFLKTSGTLCHEARPADCTRCFPQYAPQDFFLRETFLKSFLGLVDRFICPSRFLLHRYAAWGLPRDRLLLLENGQKQVLPTAGPPDAETLAGRFAFFGQISALKGIEVLLAAMALLPEAARRTLRLDIHGTVAHQTDTFIEAFKTRLAGLADCAAWHGPYAPDDLPGLMARIGWVVVPSIWWENSPLVIQEAFAHGRPVICSGIGGMAEKVAEGRTGLHVRPSDAHDLAQTLRRAADPELWQALAANVEPPASIGQTTGALLSLFETIRAERNPATLRRGKPRAALS